MAKSPNNPSINVTGQNMRLPQGSQFSLFVKGTDLYENARINGAVTVETDTGPVEVTVQTMQVGALIDLIGNYGPQNAYTYGRSYSALGLLQMLTDASPEDVLDVTKLYTAVVVMAPITPPPAMPMPIVPAV